jgi:Uma2 family endonuclease
MAGRALIDAPSRPIPRRLPHGDIVAIYDMTEEEYLAWDQEGGLADWIDGKVYQYMTVSLTHYRIVRFLVSFLSAFAAATGAGEAVGGPYAMRTRPGRTWREPDIVFATPPRS